MIDKATILVYNIYVAISEDITSYMQTYRSGHNGADSKSVCGQPHVSSNLTVCASKSRINTEFMRLFHIYIAKEAVMKCKKFVTAFLPDIIIGTIFV